MRLHLSLALLFFILPRPPRSTPFPYTTLFRSGVDHRPAAAAGGLSGDLREQRIGQGRRQHVTAACDGADRVHEVRGRGVQIGEHTSELQSHSDLVCRLLLEKKKGVTIAMPTFK